MWLSAFVNKMPNEQGFRARVPGHGLIMETTEISLENPEEGMHMVLATAPAMLLDVEQIYKLEPYFSRKMDII